MGLLMRSISPVNDFWKPMLFVVGEVPVFLNPAGEWICSHGGGELLVRFLTILRRFGFSEYPFRNRPSIFVTVPFLRLGRPYQLRIRERVADFKGFQEFTSYLRTIVRKIVLRRAAKHRGQI